MFPKRSVIRQRYGHAPDLLYRQLMLFCLGLSSGLPLALSGSVLQTWYAVSNASFQRIATLGLLGIPYLLKFLWAPVLDYLDIGGFGRRRGWIFLSQISLVITLIIMSSGDPVQSPVRLLLAATLCAFLSATQDIAIDAYRTELVPARELGLAASLASVGYRCGLFISGALGLIWAETLSWSICYRIMAGMMGVFSLVTWLSPMLPHERPSPSSLSQSILQPFYELLSREGALWVLLFIFLFKLGEAFTANSGGIINTFLLRECGLSLSQIALLNKTTGVLATMLGAVSCGVILLYYSMARSLRWVIIAQATTNLGYFLIAQHPQNQMHIFWVVFCDNFTAGMGNAVLVAFLMRICDHRYTATQFAVLSSIASLGRVILAPLVGLLLRRLSWPQFFLVTFGLGLLALPLLQRITFKMPVWFETNKL